MDYFSKQRLRKRIAGQIKDFLGSGGVIEIIPPRRVCPAHMGWIAERGWDYTPWSHWGDAIAMSKDGYERLGDNNYHRPAAKTEE